MAQHPWPYDDGAVSVVCTPSAGLQWARSVTSWVPSVLQLVHQKWAAVKWATHCVEQA